MPKIPLKISGFPLSVNWLVDKIAKFTEIFLPTSTRTPPIPTPTETVKQPMNQPNSRGTGKEYF